MVIAHSFADFFLVKNSPGHKMWFYLNCNVQLYVQNCRMVLSYISYYNEQKMSHIVTHHDVG